MPPSSFYHRWPLKPIGRVSQEADLYTVEPPKRGQHREEPFVLSREVVLFRRFLYLSLKMKHSSCLDTYTI